MNSSDSPFDKPRQRLAPWVAIVGAGAMLAAGAVARASDTPATGPAVQPFSLSAEPVPPVVEIAPATSPAPWQDTRYGPFNLLDRRSRYGEYWFPEPLRLDETDVDNELRLDWQHDQARGAVGNVVTAELEKSFGLMTVELEIPYLVQTQAIFDPLTLSNRHEQQQGVGNVSVGVRAPFYQFVSRDGFFDSTLGFGFELGIPTNSPLSKNTELVPKLFDDIRLGEHVSVQTIVGLSYLLGPKPDGGTRTLEYGVILGYNLEHEDLPLPHVERTIPLFELVGETSLNKPTYGSNTLTATVGARFNLESIGVLQPRLGFGYAFPLDKGGRQDLRQGFVLSLVFEY